jgi:hypothetical protein
MGIGRVVVRWSCAGAGSDPQKKEAGETPASLRLGVELLLGFGLLGVLGILLRIGSVDGANSEQASDQDSDQFGHVILGTILW